jgi:2-polyprenyl-3-methyl-5-hydroxy-6-metoxy-1,4-benzoquinol methylase
MSVQSKVELESWYDNADPSGYDNHPDDLRRKNELIALLPARHVERTLHVGCGNGFLTVQLPGNEIVGIDVSERAVNWSRDRARQAAKPDRFTFASVSLFDPEFRTLSRFDLVVITGVLHPQNIGMAGATARAVIDEITQPGGIIVTAHIKEWITFDLPYTIVDRQVFPYRERTLDLVVYHK